MIRILAGILSATLGVVLALAAFSPVFAGAIAPPARPVVAGLGAALILASFPLVVRGFFRGREREYVDGRGR